MRKLLLLLGIAVMLVVPAVATAQGPPPSVICALCNGGGSGWTGCTQQTASDSGGIDWISHIRHYLVVSYCKTNGTITSISIAAHGCDTSGLAFCHVGAAWQTGGGAGYGYASFEAHATYGSNAAPLYNVTSVVRLTVPVG